MKRRGAKEGDIYKELPRELVAVVLSGEEERGHTWEREERVRQGTVSMTDQGLFKSEEQRRRGTAMVVNCFGEAFEGRAEWVCTGARK